MLDINIVFERPLQSHCSFFFMTFERLDLPLLPVSIRYLGMI